MTASLEDRVRRLEDRQAIADLAVLYGFLVDERDADGLRRVFCADGSFRSADGSFASTGVEEVISAYLARWRTLGPTNHVTHGHLVRFDAGDRDLAHGVLTSHAEVVRDGVGLVVAVRYFDVYRRVDGRWRFADRLMSNMYYLPAGEYAEGFGDELSVRAPGRAARPGEWPDAVRGGDAGWLRRFV